MLHRASTYRVSPTAGRICLYIEPGRTADVTLLTGDGGEILIPQTAGGDGHYPTPVLLVAHGPLDFEAASDTTVNFTLATVHD